MFQKKKLMAFFMAVCCFLTMSMGGFAASNMINVSFQGNGGEFTVGPEGFQSNGFGVDIEAGKTMADSGFTISDPTFWDPDRAFQGWIVGCLVEKSNDDGSTYKAFEQIPGSGLLTTAQAMSYVLPNEAEVMFSAQWAGDDRDYFTQVYIDGYETEFQFEEIYWDDVAGQSATRTITTGTWGNQLKKDGTSINDQVKDFCILLTEPTRPDATFEGWLEFKNLYGVDDNGKTYEYPELVSNKVYSTSEMLNRPVPNDYDVRYVAKWSDIPVEQYYKGNDDGGNGNGGNAAYTHFIGLNGNGGQMSFMFTDDDGQRVPVMGEQSEYWMEEGKTYAEQLDENGHGFMGIRKDCAEFLGWKVYEFTNYDWVDMPQGQELNVGDPDVEFVFFGPHWDDDGVQYDRYLGMHTPTVFDDLADTDEVLNLGGSANYYVIAQWEENIHPSRVTEAQAVVKPTADQKGSYDEVSICADCGKEMERNTVELSVSVQEIPTKENEAPMQVEIQSSLVEVPENLGEQYESLQDVKDAMSEAIHEENEDFASEDVTVEHLDAELKVQKQDGSWETVTYENFPQEGIEILLPFPEGADKSFGFVITHMITEGERAGQVEVLAFEVEADGLRVKVTSLSPISIAYKKASVSVTDEFSDVYADWYTPYVQYVYDNELMTGIKGTDRFEPNANITKAQVAQVLYNMEGQPAVNLGSAKAFKELRDVYDYEWYAKAVAWAYETGVVTGDLNAKKFSPNADVTREQLALMIYRYAKDKGYDVSQTTDFAGLTNAEKVANWSMEGVRWAVGAGLISGIEKNGVKDLAPQGNATRAQVAAILQRFCENIK